MEIFPRFAGRTQEPPLMLLELDIRDLAIFEKAHVEMPAGFVSLTGETGAGKSVFLSALDLLRGQRGDAEMVRQGAEKAVVSARFRLPEDSELAALLDELGAEAEDGEIILTRELQASGRSRARIGGSSVALRDLFQVSRRLFDVHGQHSEQRLFDEAQHLIVLTRLAGAESQLQAYRGCWKAWNDARNALSEMRREAEELARRRDFLEFQWKELDDAKLLPEEEPKLIARLDAVGKLGQVGELMNQTRELLRDDSPLYAAGRKLARLGQKLSAADPKLQSLADCLNQLSELSANAAALADGYEIPAEADPEELDRWNARLAQIQRLRNRHHCNYAELLVRREKFRADLDLLEDGGLRENELTDAMAKCHEALLQAGRALSAKRHKAATQLDDEVTRRLQELGMPGAQFRTRIEALVEPSAQGLEKAVFELCPNPGEGFRDLSETASGGEASRIMLAITAVLSQASPVPLEIFDEVDTGLGGMTAGRVAEELARLAQDRQVLAVTHLPLVAASAAHQLSIGKETLDGRTRSHIRILDGSGREDEIARMLGNPEDVTVREHARKLLQS